MESEFDSQLENFEDKNWNKSDQKRRSLTGNTTLGILTKLLIENPANNRCGDCDGRNPEWASLGFGTFICLNCAGFHRSLGVHITSVRSVTLDVWSEEQVKIMELGGNQKFWDYLRFMKVQQQYYIPEVLYYTEVMKARIESREPKDFHIDEWLHLVPARNDSNSPNGSSKASTPGIINKSSKKVDWIADHMSNECMVCKEKFSFFNRKHHCRRCGKLVCINCAPNNNTRPIIEWGMREPVRHCKQCFKSPLLTWSD